MTGSGLQSGMRTHFVENIHHGTKINKIELGRVSKVNYSTYSVAFHLLTNGVNGERDSANTEYSAYLPMSMAGRNNYGKAYGEISPVRQGDIILIGFIDAKTFRPIVLGVYPDEAISQELSRTLTNDIDSSSLLDIAAANAWYKVYPDQTYDFHDGKGTRVLSLSGHSFLLANADVPETDNLEHKTDDSSMGLDYADLPSSFLHNSELIEPVTDKAPEIIFKHQGIVDRKGNPDTHALYLYIGQDGTYRVSQMKSDEDWRTYFEIKNSEIHLVRQNNSKLFGTAENDTNLISSEIGINDDGNVVIRNHDNGIMVKSDGIYNLSGEKLIGTKNAISDLILDKLGGLGFGGANLFSKSTATMNKYLDKDNNLIDRQNALVSDYIDCLGNNAYYAYAYAEHDVFPQEVSLTLVVYDSNKQFIEAKEATDIANVQIATRALPIEASYLRVSISDSSVPIMLAFGADYSAYQPSYADVKAKRNNVSNSSTQLKQDYDQMNKLAQDALSEKVLAMQNIQEAVADSNLSTADKQLLKSYVDSATSTYDNDVAYAFKYEINIEDYKKCYQQVLGRVNPILSDMSSATLITSEQITDVWEDYFTSRCNLTASIKNASERLYEASKTSVNNAEMQQNNSMLKQFTSVTQTIQSIMQTTKWTIWTDSLDLNDEKVTENIFFKGNVIRNSPVTGYQYIQVFSPITSRDIDAVSNVTQRVWSANSVASYSRVLVGTTWSEWVLDSNNSDYDSQLNNIANGLSYLGNSIADTKNDLITENTSIKQQIADSSLTLAQYKTSNDKRVGAVESSISTINSQITGINNDISSVKNSIADISQDTNSSKQRLTTVEQAIKTANSNIDSLTETVQALTKTVQDLSTKVDSLTKK